MLARAEIEKRIGVIVAGLDRLAAADANIEDGIGVHQEFEFLREQYRRSPADLAWAVYQLGQLRRRFDELVNSRLAQVIDRGHDMNEWIRQAEAEKAVWRDVLIRAATRQRVDHLAGQTASIQIRAHEARQLPPAGTDLRDLLESAVRQAGCWDHVSQLSRPKLEKVLASRQLPPDQAEQIDRLCPITIMHQVSSHPL